MPRPDAIFWNCVPETIALEEAHLGNVGRDNRNQKDGLMNPPLTKFVDYWGQPLAVGEIDGVEVEGRNGNKIFEPGLKQYFGVSGQTVRRWFGRADTLANCVPRRVFLTSKGAKRGEVVPTGQTVAGLEIGNLRRVCLAACLVAPEGLVRVDDDGEFVSTWAQPKARKIHGKEVPLVWRDIMHATTMARTVRILERITQPAHINPVYSKHGFDYNRAWVRLKIVHPQSGSYHAQDAKQQGIREGQGWKLLERPQRRGWYIIIDMTIPVLGSGDS